MFIWPCVTCFDKKGSLSLFLSQTSKMVFLYDCAISWLNKIMISLMSVLCSPCSLNSWIIPFVWIRFLWPLATSLIRFLVLFFIFISIFFVGIVFCLFFLFVCTCPLPTFFLISHRKHPVRSTSWNFTLSLSFSPTPRCQAGRKSSVLCRPHNMEANIAYFSFFFFLLVFSLIKSEEIIPFYSLLWFSTQQDTTTLRRNKTKQKTRKKKQNMEDEKKTLKNKAKNNNKKTQEIKKWIKKTKSKEEKIFSSFF